MTQARKLSLDATAGGSARPRGNGQSGGTVASPTKRDSRPLALRTDDALFGDPFLHPEDFQQVLLNEWIGGEYPLRLLVGVDLKRDEAARTIGEGSADVSASVEPSPIRRVLGPAARTRSGSSLIV